MTFSKAGICPFVFPALPPPSTLLSLPPLPRLHLLQLLLKIMQSEVIYRIHETLSSPSSGDYRLCDFTYSIYLLWVSVPYSLPT